MVGHLTHHSRGSTSKRVPFLFYTSITLYEKHFSELTRDDIGGTALDLLAGEPNSYWDDTTQGSCGHPGLFPSLQGSPSFRVLFFLGTTSSFGMLVVH